MVQVCSELEGKDINEVINEGMGKLASMPSGNHYPGPSGKNDTSEWALRRTRVEHRT